VEDPATVALRKHQQQDMEQKGTLLAAGIILIFGGIVAYRFVNETKQALALAQGQKQPWDEPASRNWK